MGHIVLISCCICCLTGIRLIIKDIGIPLKDKIEISMFLSVAVIGYIFLIIKIN